ncbi:MAG: protein tyrosine phosphatase, partial [Acinetobacter sp.]
MIKKTVIALLLSSSSLMGCMTTASLSADQRPQHWGKVLQQNNNFYQISNDIFRSEQPNAELIPYLK